jgi:uncharacterized 2Fe-2S/4Fe-4S cluster protein (DUF4445 family)
MRIAIAGQSRSCKARPDETILAALTRSGITLSAPCGGRGICGKCRITLIEGRVRVSGAADAEQCVLPYLQAESSAAGTRPGFAACRGRALSDITVELPDESAPADTEGRAGLSGLRKGRIRRAGVGVDIGTTTVSAELVDLDTGESLETVSDFNAQRNFGADIMSRINAARQGKTEELFSVINGQIESILQDFIQNWVLAGLERCHVSGNTTMLHFFTGTDPSGMGEAPFTPVFLAERNYTGRELSLSADQITVLPGVSAFVGADIVSGLACVDILKAKDTTFLVDIGTNGEMALFRCGSGTGGRLFCCSTAAGPCFEGAEISCGMSARKGAIDRIALKDEKLFPRSFSSGPLVYTTLGHVEARGICGTGLVDGMAALKKLSAMDETGALEDRYAENGFPITERIVITQKDIRCFQLAKSAILSGIAILCKRAGLTAAEVGTIYIAGGFGFFIDRDNAAAAGLLPREFAFPADSGPSGTGKIAVCGNTSLRGTVQSLIDPDFLQCCRNIIARSEVIDLAADPDFAETFAENMYF